MAKAPLVPPLRGADVRRVPSIVLVVITEAFVGHGTATIPPPSLTPPESVLRELTPAVAAPPARVRPRELRRRKEHRRAASFPAQIAMRPIGLSASDVRPVLEPLADESPWIHPAPVFGRQAPPELPSPASVFSRVTAAPPVRTAPRTRAFQVPETAVEFLSADRSLSTEQRQKLAGAIARYEERDRAYRASLRAELLSLEPLLTAELDERAAAGVVEALRQRRHEQMDLLWTTLAELRALLSPEQWQRFSGWVLDRPWAPFHSDATDDSQG